MHLSWGLAVGDEANRNEVNVRKGGCIACNRARVSMNRRARKVDKATERAKDTSF
jgi:hypothetical protein